MATNNFYSRVAEIQRTLKAPKNQFNNFGKYKYRSCEDILEAVKPILGGLVLIISDDVVQCGPSCYIKATATITDGETSLSNSALARESVTKKGMDDSQITGTASSYARKYALNGLFLIDDTKDADTMDNRQGGNQQPKQTTEAQQFAAKIVGELHSGDSATVYDTWHSVDNEMKESCWRHINAADRRNIKEAIKQEESNR